MRPAALVTAAILALMGFFYPYDRHGPRTMSSEPCNRRLVEIQAAKQKWAVEHNASLAADVTAKDILPYLPKGMPKCNDGGQYILGKVGDEPRCTVHGSLTHYKPDPY